MLIDELVDLRSGMSDVPGSRSPSDDGGDPGSDEPGARFRRRTRFLVWYAGRAGYGREMRSRKRVARSMRSSLGHDPQATIDNDSTASNRYAFRLSLSSAQAGGPTGRTTGWLRAGEARALGQREQTWWG